METVELSFALLRGYTARSWPPSPYKAFCALVEAAQGAFASKEEQAALNWFARLKVTAIRVRGITRKQLPTTRFAALNHGPAGWIKTNTSNEPLPIWQTTLTPSEDACAHLTFAYKTEDDVAICQSNINVLSTIARNVSRLGCAKDFALATFEFEHAVQSAYADQEWIADSKGTIQLDIPEDDELTRCITRHEQRLTAGQTIDPYLRCHKKGRFVESDARNAYSVFFSLRTEARAKWAASPEHLTTLAENVRTRIRQWASVYYGDDYSKPERSYFTGHEKDTKEPILYSHLKVVPLPDCGYEFATGLISRIAIVADESPAVRPANYVELMESLSEFLHGTQFQLGNIVITLQRSNNERIHRLFSGESRVWRTATPIVSIQTPFASGKNKNKSYAKGLPLDPAPTRLAVVLSQKAYHENPSTENQTRLHLVLSKVEERRKKLHQRIADQIKDELTSKGIVTPVEINISNLAQVFHRVEPRTQTRAMAERFKNSYLVHAELRFATAVQGPFVFGRGAHYGLGAFVAVPETLRAPL